MRQLLLGRRAMVVGAGPGLGAAIAGMLAEAGASVILVARREQAMHEIAEPIRARGGNVLCIAGDIDSAEDRATIAAANDGTLDIMIHNAARHGEQKPFADADMADWGRTMETNLFSPLRLTQGLLPDLRRSNAASVIFVSAMAMRMVSSVGRAGYALSKAAIHQAVRSLAYELGTDAIRVNAVVPGWMESAHVQSWRADPKLSQHVERALQSIPLGRIPLAAEVAGSVIYLASDLSKAVTGTCIDVNGGHYMGP